MNRKEKSGRQQQVVIEFYVRGPATSSDPIEIRDQYQTNDVTKSEVVEWPYMYVA